MGNTRGYPLDKRHEQSNRARSSPHAGAASKLPSRHARRRSKAAKGEPRQANTDLDRERERLQRKCEEYHQRALASEREQAEILTVVSHDVRNPLSAILVSLRILDRTIPPGTEGRRQLDAIQRSAEEINHVIQDLLDATTIETSSLMLGAKPCDVAPLVDAALASVAVAAAQKPLVLKKEVSPDLPRVLVDRDRAVQALSNLLGNAVKFTPKGGEITLRAEPSGTGALFSITDTGPGIPDDLLGELFGKYSPKRGPSTQGSGLALFVAKGIVDAHGGRIWAESRLGHGSTFFVALPSV
jgi:signal transduction histidine kinase